MADGYHTVIVKIGGYNNSWLSSRAGVKENVSNALRENNIGVSSLYDTSPLAFNPSYFEFTIGINALDSQTEAQIKQIILQAISGTLTSPTVEIVSGNPEQSSLDKILENITGGDTASKVAGISLGTMALLAVAGIVILPILLQPQMRGRY